MISLQVILLILCSRLCEEMKEWEICDEKKETAFG